jgi:hypothetical protein
MESRIRDFEDLVDRPAEDVVRKAQRELVRRRRRWRRPYSSGLERWIAGGFVLLAITFVLGFFSGYPTIGCFGPIFLFVVIFTLAIVQRNRTVPAQRLIEKKCPDCGYDLAACDDAVPLRLRPRMHLGPRACPECGIGWPLPPPPVSVNIPACHAPDKAKPQDR